jgi:hypothetical protein
MTVRRSKLGPTVLLRFALAALLGVGAALLVACGSSGGGLIPAGNAGPLQHDFDRVAQLAQEGDGSCTATEAAIHKTESDFEKLPSTINSGLHERLEQGIENLNSRARALCAEPLASATGTTGTSTSTATTPPPTTTAKTETTPTTPAQTTPTTPTGTTPSTTTTPDNEGGTPAPGPGEVPPSEGEAGNEEGAGAGAGALSGGTGGSGAGQ